MGRVTIFGTWRVMPAVGVGRRRVEAMKGRLGSMTPMSSFWRNCSGTTPRLSLVMRSARSRYCVSWVLIRSPDSARMAYCIHVPP